MILPNASATLPLTFSFNRAYITSPLYLICCTRDARHSSRAMCIILSCSPTPILHSIYFSCVFFCPQIPSHPHPGPTKREQRLLRSWLLPKFKISLLKLQDCQIISSTPMRYCRTAQPTGDMVEHQTTRILERSIMRVRFSMPLGK